MINKVLPVQGLSPTLNTSPVNAVNSSELALAGNESKANKFPPSRRDMVTEPKANVQAANARANAVNAKNSKNVPEKEETFKKSLKTAITEKSERSEAPAPTSSKPNSSKIGKTSSIENQREVMVEETDDISSNPLLASSMGQTQKTQIVQEPENLDLMEGNGELQAVMKFMKSMEDEFGVSAQELVGVMSNLALQVQNNADVVDPNGNPLVGNAAITGNQSELFQKLGLEGGQVKRAEYLYQNMLKEMAQNSMAGYLKEQDKEASIQVLSPTELRKRDMNRSIDRLSQSFFMNDIRPPYGKQLQPNVEQAQVQNAEGAKVSPQTSDDSGAMALPAGMEILSQPQMMSVEGAESNVTRDIDQKNQNSNSNNMSSGGMALAGLMAPISGSSAGSGASFDSSSDDSKSSEFAQSSAKGSIENSEASVTNDSASTIATTTNPKAEIAKPGSEVFSLNAPANEIRKNDVRPEDAANVRSLIQGAQVLMRQGGGEMKVQMYPEGLGQVDLKVAVKDGKVDIQILADTADTKRLLEKGMGDLKTSLASHRLEVNNVKVDVSQNTERDLNQGQSEFNREQARQFLGQFRDERESMRGFGDTPRLRSYKTSNANQITPESGKEKEPAVKNSSRLNVIA